MPNWTRNMLKIRKSDIDKVVLNDNVDFGILIPMPESLKIESGSSNFRDIYIYFSNRCKASYEYVCTIPLIRKILSDKLVFSTLDQLLSDTRNSAYYFIKHSEYEEVSKAFDTGRQLVENYQKYGATTWYDWSINNWGCKWNASETEITEEKDHFTIWFNTPWSAPYKWLQKLAESGVDYNYF